MDERAKIPVLLPHANPTKALWQEPLAAMADLRSTKELPQEAEVVIIGSGITGAAVAWNLLTDMDSPLGSVVMLEARQACSGATGRNGTCLRNARRSNQLTGSRGSHQGGLIPVLYVSRR